MRQYDLALEKYWVTYSGYFRLETTVSLSMVITYGKLICCHGVSEVNVGRKVSTLEYKNRKVYYCLNDPLTDEFGIPDLNLPPTPIDDRLCPHEISRYTSDLLPAAI